MSRPSSDPTQREPRPPAAEIRRRLAGELSLRSRVVYTLLLLVDLAVGGIAGALLLTEPGLPPRTRVAFAAMVAIAAVWAVVFVWTLTRRKVLLARHRLVTSRLAVVFTGLFTLGAVALALSPEQRRMAVAAAVFGAVLLSVALILWRRAAGRYRRLLARARELEAELGSRAAPCLLALLLAAGPLWPAAASAVEGFGAPPVELRLGSLPVPVRALGRQHLVYELHVTNLAAEPRRLTALAVRDGNGVPLGAWTGPELARRVTVVGAPVGDQDAAPLLPAGGRAVVFLWLAGAPGAPAPSELRHRLTSTDAAGGQVDTVVGAAVAVPVSPTPVGEAPVGAGRWVALRGPSNGSGHRRSLVALDGTLAVPQRFAVDWVRLGDDGRFFRGDGAANDDWYGWRRPVLAARAGRVVRVVRDIPDHPPGSAEAAAFLTRDQAAGNVVVIDEGAGRYAVYAHLRHGSIAVAEGETVVAGAPLAEIGNTGHSRAPHLHFHVATAPDPLAGEGLPFTLAGFRLIGKLDDPGAMIEGADWRPDPRRPPRSVAAEVPLQGMVLQLGPPGVRRSVGGAGGLTAPSASETGRPAAGAGPASAAVAGPPGPGLAEG